MALSTFVRACIRNIAGNRYLFLTEAVNVTNVTVTSGEVSDITMAFGESFKQIQADQDGPRRLEGGTGRKESFYFEHLIEFGCSKASVSLNDFIEDISDASHCGIIAIVVDNNGQGWLIGWNEWDKKKRPMYLSQDNFTSGAGLNDDGANRHDIILRCTSGAVDLPLDSTLNAYVLAQIATGQPATLGFTQPTGATADSTLITADSTLITVDST